MRADRASTRSRTLVPVGVALGVPCLFCCSNGSSPTVACRRMGRRCRILSTVHRENGRHDGRRRSLLECPCLRAPVWLRAPQTEARFCCSCGEPVPLPVLHGSTKPPDSLAEVTVAAAAAGSWTPAAAQPCFAVRKPLERIRYTMMRECSCAHMHVPRPCSTLASHLCPGDVKRELRLMFYLALGFGMHRSLYGEVPPPLFAQIHSCRQQG